MTNNIATLIVNANKFSTKQDASKLYDEITELANRDGVTREIVTKIPIGAMVRRSSHFQAWYNETEIYLTNKYF